MKTFFLSFFFLFVSAEAEVINNIQVGYEYDSNVYKTFSQPIGDSLVRSLFQSQGVTIFSPRIDLGWNFQLGGKKYFNQDPKDVFIQYIEAPLGINFENRSKLIATTEFKYQNENDALGTLPPGLPKDVNEDFYTPDERLQWIYPLTLSVVIEPYAEYSYFKFSPSQKFSYHFERGGLEGRKQVGNLMTFGGSYAFEAQQFLAGDRQDEEHEIATWFQFSGIPYASVRYAYQHSSSSIPSFSFSNHRVSLLCSIPFGGSLNSQTETSQIEDGNSLFVFHVLATIQFKKYPSVFGSTVEGIRYLLTDGEDENFNTLLAKLTYHPLPHFTLESKLTRFSNEFSSQPSNFTRYLAYLGARYSF